jgi:hypothetical protein
MINETKGRRRSAGRAVETKQEEEKKKRRKSARNEQSALIKYLVEIVAGLPLMFGLLFPLRQIFLRFISCAAFRSEIFHHLMNILCSNFPEIIPVTHFKFMGKTSKATIVYCWRGETSLDELDEINQKNYSVTASR